MRPRLAATLVCLALVGGVSCTGGPKRVSTYGPTAATSRASTAGAIPGVPRVMVQMGTSYADGALIRFCKGASCEKGPGRPSRTLEGTDPLLFIVEQKPVSATAELRAAGAAAPADSVALRGGTTMLFAPHARPGSYWVTLTANWKGRSGSWAFRVTIPRV